MSDAPEASSNEISMQELVQGIGRLIIKLNDSVSKVDKRIENLETGISTILEEQFKTVTEELSRANELLASMSSGQRPSAPAPEGPAADTEAGAQAPYSEALLPKLEEIRTELTGIREDIGSAEEKMLKALSDGPSDGLKAELFKDSLNDLSVMVSESTKSIEDAMGRTMEESDGKRAEDLTEKTGLISQALKEISDSMESVKDGIEEKLEEIRTDTAREVAAIEEKVEENTRSQGERLEQMKELLSLHSVEVQDNHVRDLNRRAIVHFNNAEYDRAMSDLREALELSPESAELLANMAHIEAYQGNLENAEEHFRKALETDPDLEPALSGLGTVLVMSGRPGDTIDFLQKYIEEGSGASTGVMIALSRAYAAQDNHARALSLLEEAEKAAPGHPELEQELARYRS